MKLSIHLVAGLLIVLAGCATENFTLLNPKDGWQRLSGPPPEVNDILAVAGDQINNRYRNHDGFEIVWFARGADEYLIYFYSTRNDYPKPEFRHCFEEADAFKRTNQGWQSESGLFPISICGYE